MITDKHIQAGREVLRKFIADDGLKPEYNGMTAWEIAKLILEAADKADMAKAEAEDHDCAREAGDGQDSCPVCDKEEESKDRPF